MMKCLIRNTLTKADDHTPFSFPPFWNHRCGPSLPKPLSGTKILVVHESTTISATLVDIFHNAGARAMEANAPQDAAILIAWGGYDVIFLDAAIPAVEEVMELIQRSDPSQRERTVVLTEDLQSDQSARLRRLFGGFFFQGSLLIDLVELATTIMAISEQRMVA